MGTPDWRRFLERFSREVLSDRDHKNVLPAEVVASEWLGFPPATADMIDEVERRLGAKLPESYRSFLLTTNGWRNTRCDCLPVQEITWFRESQKDWLDAWEEGAKLVGTEPPPISDEEYFDYDKQDTCNFRHEHWRATLAISGVGDGSIYLLNPLVLTADGEWEAWFFANWLPGAFRYRSLWELMQKDLESFVAGREHNERRYFPEDGIETLRPKLPALIKALAQQAARHLEGQQWRVSEGRLTSAEADVRSIEAQRLSGDQLLGRLNELAEILEQKWKTNFRAGTSAVDKRRGTAEGNREANGIMRWFLNHPAECGL